MVDTSSLARPTGRPRGFDAADALRAARDLFWRKGYEQSTLDELIAAMGISRSSFYACFTSKHVTLARALTLYSDEAYAKLVAIVTLHADPGIALCLAMESLADATGGRRGCFLANCISELGPHDAEIDRIVRAQISRITDLFCPLLTAIGHDDPRGTARLLLALALGVIGLRKIGLAPGDVLETLHTGLNTIL